MTVGIGYQQASTLALLGGQHPADAPGVDAACHSVDDPEIFFPAGETAVRSYGAAMAICAGCRIRVACAEWAIRRASIRGIWGGTSTKDRQQIRHNRRRAAA